MQTQLVSFCLIVLLSWTWFGWILGWVFCFFDCTGGALSTFSSAPLLPLAATAFAVGFAWIVQTFWYVCFGLFPVLWWWQHLVSFCWFVITRSVLDLQQTMLVSAHGDWNGRYQTWSHTVTFAKLVPRNVGLYKNTIIPGCNKMSVLNFRP